jgi:hypothetical protein
VPGFQASGSSKPKGGEELRQCHDWCAAWAVVSRRWQVA